ncbi:MAG TPA: ATP-dependent DNA ligase [Kofleriaceae bacterium]|nr:ATP-dependent DNA ligase [Kofleriaceae bacterium]
MPLQLPFQPPIEPMLAKLSHDIPDGNQWIYEPKWDGFRALVFKSGNDVYIQSRDLKPLGRYFPELEVILREQLPDRCVLDGEIVIATDGRLDFEALLLRIHPAATRVKMLADEKPSSYVAWDLLAFGDEDLRGLPQAKRRERLEEVMAHVRPPVHVTPATRDKAIAHDWFSRFEGAGLDGVIAKPDDLPYMPGKRLMTKVKHQRTVDCVVAGFRWYKGGKDRLVGSLLLGLYDKAGVLHHVGVCASFKQAERAALTEKLAPYREGALEAHPWKDWADWQEIETERRLPGATSRWNRGKDLSWVPLRIELTVEVSFDHMQGTRFRHGSHLKRWRPDKPPSECTYEQLEVTPPQEIKDIFGHRG